LIIDSASANKAEEFMDHLRATLGSLPVVPLKCHGDAANIMTHWLQDTAPKTFELDNECELQNTRESKNIVRCKNQELESSEVLSHLKAGKRVTQMAMIWRDAIRFILTEDFAVKRLRFEEIIQEQAESDVDDRATQFDQDFSVMVLQLHEFIKELLEEFGGIEKE
jgi:recombination associated protein RdgC